jgi:general secretion pathway protein G
MKRPTPTRRFRSRGFTLVEMLVVLAILVLLVGMVAPRVLKSRKKADINSAKAQIGMLRSCLERYAVDMKDFPTTEEGLSALIRVPEEGEFATANWDGPYVNQPRIPKDPWGNDYQYEYPPTHGSGDYPDIWSYGPDGEDETEDDIVSWGSTDGGEEGIDEGMEDQEPLEPEPEPDYEDELAPRLHAERNAGRLGDHCDFGRLGVAGAAQTARPTAAASSRQATPRRACPRPARSDPQRRGTPVSVPARDAHLSR